MQLSQERVIGCLDDGVSIVQACDDDFLKVEVVIVDKEEYLYWARKMDLPEVAHEEHSQDFKLAA